MQIGGGQTERGLGTAGRHRGAAHEALGAGRLLHFGLGEIVLFGEDDGAVGLVALVRLDGFEGDEFALGVLGFLFFY